MRVLLLLLLVSAPLQGQWLDRDHTWDRDQWEHFAAGAAVDLAIRPLLKESLNTPAKRIGLVCAIGFAYELTDFRRRAGDGYVGIGLLDIVADCLGAVLMEVLF